MDNEMNRFMIALQKLMGKYKVEYTLGTFEFSGSRRVSVTHIDSIRVIANSTVNAESESESDSESDD